jgi:hypothetical protein
MEKFARALRLRWPWLAWNSSDRPWVGMENPCNKDDMELFYGLTSITIGNGNKASFWVDYWVDGISPKVLAPSIYAISRQKLRASAKPSPMMLGFGILTIRRGYPSNTYKNSPPYGGTHLNSSYMMIPGLHYLDAH